MSKEFFRNIAKSSDNNSGGKLFVVIDNSSEKEELLGQKMFICDGKHYYNNDNYKDFWKDAIVNIDATTPNIHTLKNGVKIFAEPLGKRPTIILCGGGHVSSFVYKVAIMVGFDVVIIDDREEFANKERFPLAKEIICGEFSEVMQNVNYGKDSYYIIATRGHSHDGICLVDALKKPHTYIGMIGSRRKVAVLNEHLRSLGFTDEEISSVHTPIGLSIGAQTPEEISISIMAEVIGVRRTEKIESFITDEAVNLIATTDEDVVLSMILVKSGSIPRGAGAKMAVTKSGIMAGSIGGGAIEYEAKLDSMKIAGEKFKPYIHNYSMHNVDAKKEGMACGGDALVYVEPIL